MGKIDIETKNYFKSRERFADLFNYKLFDGKQVIQPEELMPADSAELSVPNRKRSRYPIQRFRDNINLWTAMRGDQAVYVILGIESQTDIHYAMPVRSMLYDAMNYARQVQQAADFIRNKSADSQSHKPPSSSEYLSGFRKEDRLTPVITLILYFSSDLWDGPRSLHEMMNTNDNTILEFVPDYQIHLVSPSELHNGEYRKFRTSLGRVLEFIRCSGNKDNLNTLIQDDLHYRRIDRDSANLISLVTGMDLSFPESEETIDMCKAIDDMRSESEAIGFSKGEASGFSRGEASGFSRGEQKSLINSIRNVMESFHVSMEEAMDCLKIAPEQRNIYRDLLNK